MINVHTELETEEAVNHDIDELFWMYINFLKVFTLKTWAIVHKGGIMRANDDFFRFRQF